MKKLFKYILPFFLLFFIDACKKTDTFQSDQLTDYLQLQVGKYIIYRMDSIQYINFGTEDTIVSYLAKDVIEDSVVDNLGRPSWRVIRYLSDTTGRARTSRSMARALVNKRLVYIVWAHHPSS